MKIIEYFILFIIIISFGLGVFYYNQLPLQIALHWNAKGQADGYALRPWVFLMPVISIVLFLLFLLIPKIDPLKENVKKFRKYFDNFILIVFLFLFYIHLLFILWNLGARFNMTVFLIPAMAALFYFAGVMTENAEQNWFIGIRTPWTLSSPRVWEKTNKLGGKLFKVSAAISLLGFVFQDLAICFVIIPAITSALYLLLYSYLQYKK